MSLLPVLTGDEVVAALGRGGFLRERQRGSHLLRHPDGRTTVVPVHRSEDLDRGTLRKILRDCGLSPGDFLALLRG